MNHLHPSTHRRDPTPFPTPQLTNRRTNLPQDVADLTDFGIPQNVDFIAASFVRKGSDIDHIRHVLGDAGGHIKVSPSVIP